MTCLNDDGMGVEGTKNLEPIKYSAFQLQCLDKAGGEGSRIRE